MSALREFMNAAEDLDKRADAEFEALLKNVVTPAIAEAHHWPDRILLQTDHVDVYRLDKTHCLLNK